MQSGNISLEKRINFTKQTALEANKHTKAHTNIIFRRAVIAIEGNFISWTQTEDNEELH